MSEHKMSDDLPENPSTTTDDDREMEVGDEYPLIDDVAARQFADRAMIRTITSLICNASTIDDFDKVSVKQAIEDMIESACERGKRIFESDLYGDQA